MADQRYEEDILTAAQLARALQLRQPRTVHRLAMAGRIPHYRIGTPSETGCG